MQTRVTHSKTAEQDMDLPKGQDTIQDDGGVFGWTEGPLPSQDLEQAACELFADSHPIGLWAEPNMKAERDQARRQILRAYVRFLKSQRWTLGTMHDRLEDGFGRIVFGDRGPSAAEAKLLRDYAASCIADLFSIFAGDEQAKQASSGWKYVPEDEPDDSELEDLGPSKAKVQ